MGKRSDWVRLSDPGSRIAQVKKQGSRKFFKKFKKIRKKEKVEKKKKEKNKKEKGGM